MDMLSYEELVIRTSEKYKLLDEAFIADHNIDQAKIDIFKDYVEICVPSVKNLMSDNEWRKLLDKYLKRINDIRKNPNILNNSLYLIDFIVLLACEKASEKGKRDAYNLFCAFDNIINELRSKINSSQDLELAKRLSGKLDGKIVEAVKTGETKADHLYNSLFKNLINEIAFLHYIVTNTPYSVIDMEVPISNGCDIDFQLVFDGAEWLVDTVSIQNLYGDDFDQKFLTKVGKKYDKKTKNLNDPQLLKKIRIAPIIVYDDKRLINYDPQLPPDKYFPPFLAILEFVENRQIVNLYKLPLSEQEKEWFKKMMG